MKNVKKILLISAMAFVVSASAHAEESGEISIVPNGINDMTVSIGGTLDDNAKGIIAVYGSNNTLSYVAFSNELLKKGDTGTYTLTFDSGYTVKEGDGFDSNGDGLISGGTVLVNSPTSGGNGVFDVGDNNNTLKVTGGTIIGAGTSDMAVTPSSGTQYYVVTGGSSQSGGRPGQGTSSGGITSQSAGKAFRLTNSSGEEIATYIPSKSYSWVLVSSPDITSGSYTLTYGGSASGGTVTGSKDGVYGLMTDGTFTGTSSVSLTAAQ